MSAAIRMRDDYSADELLGLARTCQNGAQARRLMSLAAVVEGKSRLEAAAIGLMDRQTLRDWVIRFNDEGPSRLISTDGNDVTFKWKDYRKNRSERQKVMTLKAHEFIRRFLIHVLPHRFHRIRHTGLFANGNRADNIAKIHHLLRHPNEPDTVTQDETNTE